MRRLVFLLALVACAAAAPAGGTSMVGEQRILVVLTTWGPEPFDRDLVRQVVFDDASEFVRKGSFGKAWFAGDVTPWLNALPSRPDCDYRLIARLGQAAALAAGFDAANYARVVFVHPRVDCPYTGFGSGDQAFLNGALYPMLVAHELGHTYGLAHANSWECVRSACGAREYGNPYSVMGNGSGDFTAYEKNVLGWLSSVARPAAGALDLYRLELPSGGSQALEVTTARNEYWLEYRGDTRDVPGRVHPGGVLVNAGANPFAPVDAIPRYGAYNLLLPDPVGRGAAALRPGDRFGEPGAFELRVLDEDGVRARVQFAWTDTKAPVVRPLPAPRVAGRFLEVGWPEALETGSGVERYEVSLDGKAPARIATESSAPTVTYLPKPRRGRHRVSVVAVDRAGNRSAPAARSFVVAR